MTPREKSPIEEHFAEVKRAVEVSAATFARRVWWVDCEDLKQQGWMYATEIMNKQRTFDPSVGVPLFGYLRRAISRLLYNYVCAESSPVSARRQNAGVLKGLQRAPESDIPEATCDLECDILALFTDGDRRAKLTTMLNEAVGEETAELGIPYLIGEEKNYKTAALRAGVSVDVVKLAVRRVRKAVSDSPAMWRLWI